jgi:hypothetical protein
MNLFNISSVTVAARSVVIANNSLRQDPRAWQRQAEAVSQTLVVQ